MLEQMQLAIFFDLLPIMICMGILGVLGAIGNVLTIVFFSRCKRSSTMILILCLATADLVVCIMTIPKIFEMSILITNRTHILCKMTHFLVYLAISCSCLFLVVIAVDRYRKICHAFKAQLSLKATRYLVAGIVVILLLVSSKHFFGTDCVPVHVTLPKANLSIEGFYCTTTLPYGTVSSVLDGFDAIVFACGWTVLVYSYLKIVLKLFELKRKRVSSRINSACNSKFYLSEFSKDSDGTENDSTVVRRITIDMKKLPGRETLKFKVKSRFETNLPQLKRSFSEQDILDVMEEENVEQNTIAYSRLSRANSEGDIAKLDQRCLNTQPDTARLDIRPNLHRISEDSDTLFSWSVPASVDQTLTLRTQQRLCRRAKAAVSVKENRMTFMLLAVSLLYIICFVPYFVVKIVNRHIRGNSTEYEISISVQIAFSLVYLNSMMNPFVYLIFNPDFRRFIRCKTPTQQNVSSFYPNYVQ